MEIEGVSVYKNRQLIANDKHKGETGSTSNGNTYSIKIGEYETGAEFKIKANVRGDTGNDSYGIVFIRRKE